MIDDVMMIMISLFILWSFVLANIAWWDVWRRQRAKVKDLQYWVRFYKYEAEYNSELLFRFVQAKADDECIQKNKKEDVCSFCGAELITYPGGGDVLYCSDGCGSIEAVIVSECEDE